VGGNIHPAQALRQYRSEFVGDGEGRRCGMTSNGFTLADPNDRGMMDWSASHDGTAVISGLSGL